MKAIWLVIGSYTFLWGVWIANPFFEAFSARAGLYSKMGEFLPEWIWGLHAIIIGVSILYGILYQWPRGVWWGHIANIYHWAIVGFFYALGDLHNTGALTATFVIALTHVAWLVEHPPVRVYLFNHDEKKTSS